MATLKETLDKFPKGWLVRVGTLVGHQFIYAGKADEFPYEWLNQKYTQFLTDEEKKQYVPWEDRTVVDDYLTERMKKNLDVIIVEGEERPTANEYREMDLIIPTLSTLNELGVDNLRVAVMRKAQSDLVRGYKKLRFARNDYYSSLREARRIEDYIREDPLLLLSDPESLIDETRRMVFGKDMI